MEHSFKPHFRDFVPACSSSGKEVRYRVLLYKLCILLANLGWVHLYFSLLGVPRLVSCYCPSRVMEKPQIEDNPPRLLKRGDILYQQVLVV